MTMQSDIAALVASAVIAAFIIGGPASAQDRETIKLVERASTDVVTDVGDEGDSVGDILTFNNALYDEANQNEVGRDNGWCMRTAVGVAWECFWTATLEGGQITVAGPFLDSGDSVLAITGGTGAYAGARGEMSLHPRNGEGTEYDFAYSVMR
jgi:allene oxide cyclase